MCKVTRIEWTYRTADAEANSSGARVSVEVFRDGELMADLSDDASSPAHLEQPSTATRALALPVSASEFPNGVRGHLDVRFQVNGHDAWQIRGIESTIVLAEQRPMLDAFGGYEWREAREQFAFDGVGVIHADPCEETAILELSY